MTSDDDIRAKIDAMLASGTLDHLPVYVAEIVLRGRRQEWDIWFLALLQLFRSATTGAHAGAATRYLFEFALKEMPPKLRGHLRKEHVRMKVRLREARGAPKPPPPWLPQPPMLKNAAEWVLWGYLDLYIELGLKFHLAPGVRKALAADPTPQGVAHVKAVMSALGERFADRAGKVPDGTLIRVDADVVRQLPGIKWPEGGA